MGTRRFTTDRAEGGLARPERYRLVVIGSTVEEVVAAAGGFLCDRAQSGWEVNVVLVDGGDAGALAILGSHRLLRIDDLGDMLQDLLRGEALAVSVALFDGDTCVRDSVVRAARRGVTDVTMWGRPADSGTGAALWPAAHRLSPAARAFKAHALAASGHADGDEEVGAAESLFRLARPAPRRLYSV